MNFSWNKIALPLGPVWVDVHFYVLCFSCVAWWRVVNSRRRDLITHAGTLSHSKSVCTSLGLLCVHQWLHNQFTWLFPEPHLGILSRLNANSFVKGVDLDMPARRMIAALAFCRKASHIQTRSSLPVHRWASLFLGPEQRRELKCDSTDDVLDLGMGMSTQNMQKFAISEMRPSKGVFSWQPFLELVNFFQPAEKGGLQVHVHFLTRSATTRV